MTGIQLDYETADRITLLSLKDHLAYLKEEVRAHEEDGQWLHPEDYHKNITQLIPSLETLISYYGG